MHNTSNKYYVINYDQVTAASAFIIKVALNGINNAQNILYMLHLLVSLHKLKLQTRY
jgi:hypothetical protein